MSQPKSELTGIRPRQIVKKTADTPGVNVRWTEAHHIAFLRLGGSKWLRDAVEQADKPQATGTEARVCDLIAARQRLGIAKYQTTVEDNPLPLRDWLRHQLDELLDAAIYCQRALEQLDKQQDDGK